MNGGCGCLWLSFSVREVTAKASALTEATIFFASASVVITIEFAVCFSEAAMTRLPSYLYKEAMKGCLEWERESSALIDQYSWGVNASIRVSRSQINLT